MAYTQPTTILKILKGVPLDKDYNHTLYFTNATAQYNSFITFTKYTYTDFTFQRANKGTIRVARKVDDLYDCNYIMFQNSSYGNKWFYAFLDEVNYVNDATSELVYTIDVMQTWYFDYELGSCFVEREHTLTDFVGENIVPEDCSFGTYYRKVIGKKTYTLNPNLSQHPEQQLCVVLCITPKFYEGGGSASLPASWEVPEEPENVIENQTTGLAQVESEYNLISNEGKFDNYYTPYVMRAIPVSSEKITTSHGGVNKTIWLINGYERWADRVGQKIINAYICPKDIFDSCFKHDVYYRENLPAISGSTINYYTQDDKFYSNYSGYVGSSGSGYSVPKNNKLLTSPYYRIMISDSQGNNKEYYWELSNSNINTGKKLKKILFKFIGCAIPSVELCIYPDNYNKQVNGDFNNALFSSDYMTLAISEAAFIRWWEQNKTSIALNMVGSGLSSAITLGNITYTPIKHLISKRSGKMLERQDMSLYNNISTTIGNSIDHQHQPNNIVGSLQAQMIRQNEDRYGFTIYEEKIQAEDMEVIDNYFSMFGYAIKKVKIPNVRKTLSSSEHLRPHWNFIKTQGVVIHSANNTGLPSDAESKISSIYDNGITFWMNASEVGNYSLDNSPII